ncbi:MAG: Smr/MutS family protein [Betaproteobacteria bacterium]|nr:Smr/MutS family protein [Betaproteobacteria bacterium]
MRGRVDDDDRALFRAAVADARPLEHDRVHLEAPRPRPVPVQHRRDEAQALHESLHAPPTLDLRLEGGDELRFARPGISRLVLRDLRRGRWVLQDQLDLHGATREEARHLLGGFLAACLRRHLRCVRVIHGKGHGSPGREPVLKTYVAGWLAHRAEVLAFCQARPQDGGAGAVVVLLKAAQT